MVKSRLGQSLLRLEDNLAEIRREQERAAVAQDEWHERWRGHQAQISRRLELIELRLDEHIGEETAHAPRLSVVGSRMQHTGRTEC